MQLDIQQQIQQVFTERGGTPLFFIESGSRLWGIASPDSDYDVRGVHLPSKAQYFDFRKHRDLIELMDGDFDFVSYDLDKLFGLLAKSNPTVLEWLRAHIVYHNAYPEFETFKSNVLANIDFKALYHHYLSIAKGTFALIESNRMFTYKKVFYCIRGLLSAELASQHVMPELLIDKLLAQTHHRKEIVALAENSLEAKRQQVEKQGVPEAARSKILRVLRQEIELLGNREVTSSNKRNQLEALLTEEAIRLKERYYG
ncbi:MAG: nucleotidyltransferase domain-containing protein [Bacteroidota bacterium]